MYLGFKKNITANIFISTIGFFVFLFTFLAIFPKSAYALGCSITPVNPQYNAGDNISLTVNYDAVDRNTVNIPDYVIQLTPAGAGSPITVLRYPNPNQVSSNHNITIPNVAAGQYNLIVLGLGPKDFYGNQAPTGNSAQCFSPTPKQVTGTGSTSPSCAFTPSSINENIQITVSASNLPNANAIYAIFFSGRKDAVTPSTDFSNSFSVTFHPSVFTTSGIETVPVTVNGPGLSAPITCGPGQLTYSPAIQLVQPVSPVTLTDPATLPVLSVSGLTPGWEYTIKLTGWKGADLVHSQISSGAGRYNWRADSSGTITAQNICNNGQADRTASGSGGACTDPFGPGAYVLTITQLDSYVVKPYLEFHVGSGGSSTVPAGPAGANPCGTGICNTAIGSLSTDPKGFATGILGVATGLAGGIALIIMVIGSVKMLTSSGDQQKLNSGREMIVAAIAGLIFLIFSVLLLRFIGLGLLGAVPGI